MKRIMLLLGVSIILALLTVFSTLFGWWIGASLPLDISNATRQILALLTASAFTWILYFISRKILSKISVHTYRIMHIFSICFIIKFAFYNQFLQL